MTETGHLYAVATDDSAVIYKAASGIGSWLRPPQEDHELLADSPVSALALESVASGLPRISLIGRTGLVTDE
jgi:hypothetical protein